MPRPNEGRKKETHSLASATSAALAAYTKRTGVPMGRVIDRAVAEYLKDEPEGKALQEDA